jgi:hypothetical protein
VWAREASQPNVPLRGEKELAMRRSYLSVFPSLTLRASGGSADSDRGDRGTGVSRPGRKRLRFVLAVLLSSGASSACAEESMFSFVYTTDLLPQGAKEVEQWVTLRHQKIAGTYDQIEGRTEFEYGLASNLQVAIYANYAWTQAYHNGPFGATTPPEQFGDYVAGADDVFNAKRFTGVSGELIYRILSPYTDGIGLALYTEPTIGKNFFELENKVILQKNFFDDLLTVAFNFTYAPEYRNLSGDADPTVFNWQEETDINFGLAVSYRFIENWSAGFEFLNEREYNSFDFTHLSNSGYYLGPTIHYGGERFFVTATALWQMPWATVHADTVPGSLVNGYVLDNDFEKFRFRLKAGYTF